jgi:hypothetical protein
VPCSGRAVPATCTELVESGTLSGCLLRQRGQLLCSRPLRSLLRLAHARGCRRSRHSCPRRGTACSVSSRSW